MSDSEFTALDKFAVQAMDMDDVAVSRDDGVVTVTCSERVDGVVDATSVVEMGVTWDLEVSGVHANVDTGSVSIEFVEAI